MFSNSSPNKFAKTSNQPWNSNINADQSPYSPQTLPFSLPINSFKSFQTNSPGSPNMAQL